MLMKYQTWVNAALLLVLLAYSHTAKCQTSSPAPRGPVIREIENTTDFRSPKAIAAIQRALSEYGYGQLKPTGTLTPETVQAISKFERQQKRRVSGEVSAALVQRLSEVLGHQLQFDPQEMGTHSNSSAATSFEPRKETEGSQDSERGLDSYTFAQPTFRWPVSGKVVTSYGAKTNGKSNDGINVAVPEGTPVKAAEDGVVAYSGNELKGYGNLVLVRHSNGYVTAYAHASELLVKRGDAIKRGQVIAKSGQSGEVGSPQLHFEIRKGSSPVNPMGYLNAQDIDKELN